jgi:hypothetical protein
VTDRVIVTRISPLQRIRGLNPKIGNGGFVWGMRLKNWGCQGEKGENGLEAAMRSKEDTFSTSTSKLEENF